MSPTVVGVARCARGRADGIGLFDASARGFLLSFAPLLAFPVIAGGVAADRNGAAAGAAELAGALCGLLCAPVLSHFVARAMGREAQWLRYAVASNWCQWIIPVSVFAALQAVWAAAALSGARTLPDGAAVGVMLTCVLYWAWLQWFLARRGLELSAWRAAAAVALVNGGTFVIVSLPEFFR